MSLRLTLIFLTPFATVFAAPKPDVARCTAIAQKIEENFKEVKDFEGFPNHTVIFSYNNVRYNVEANNSRIQGVDQTTTETVKECEAPGNRSLSMKVHLNMGNPRIVSDVYYTNQDKITKKVEVASYASSDIVFEALIHYNEDWKRIAVVYMNLAKSTQFVSDSDCEDGIQFCDALHSRLDNSAWNQITNGIPYLMKQALFRMQL